MVGHIPHDAADRLRAAGHAVQRHDDQGRAWAQVVLRVPTLTDFDRDPLELIETGDWVEIDADAGEVRVWKNRNAGD
jgi:hypothetical protein